jgi:hypothetical protein
VPWLGRGLSDFDRTHRMAVTYEYEMPGFGTGLMRSITGKWSVGGVTLAQSALPIAFTCTVCPTYNVYGITSSSALSPDVIGDFRQISKGGSPTDYLDPGTSAFNSGILAAPTILTSGQTLAANLNAQGGPGNQTYIVGPVNGTTYRGVLFGSLPRNPGPRGQFQQQWDANIARTFSITEKFKLRLDGQFFNLFNHVTFSNPAAAVGSSSFGRVTGTQSQPRIIAIAGRLEF